MMKFFQSCSKKILIKCILGLIILSIILGTLNNYIHRDTTKYIAQVNEEKISFETLKNTLDLEINKQKNILNNNSYQSKNDQQFKKNIYNYVLSQLINNVLLEQYTKNVGFNIDNNEIKNVILTSNIFQEKNKFSNTKYLNYLNSVNLTNREYIELIKKKLNTINFINTIAKTDFILDNEKTHIIQLLSQKRMIQKEIFKINPLKHQNIKNIEILNYFNNNQTNFYTPEQFKINYIYIQPNTINEKCNDQEINNWYKKNIYKYSTPEQRNYSIIQVKTKKDALLILSQLKKGKKFSKIAQEKSIEPISSKKGGNIGWIPIHLTPKEIKQANLNKNHPISNIIQFNNEFLIVKLNNILSKKTKKINEVYKTIEAEIKQKKALQKYNQLKNKIIFVSKKYQNKFDLITKECNLKNQQTQWFDQDSIPKIFKNPILQNIIFQKKLLDQNEQITPYAKLIELKNNQLFLLNVKNFKIKKLKTLKEVKNQIVNILKYNKALQTTKEKTQKILFELNNGNKNILKQKHLLFKQSETLSRYDDNPITSKIFSIPHTIKNKKIYVMYQDKNNNFVIAFVSKIFNAQFQNKEKEIIIKYLEKNNIEKIFNCIINNLHKTSKIIYNKIENV